MTDVNLKQIKRPLVLKFEYERQQYELSSLTTADTVADLRAVICSMLNIDDFRRINLKTLQPTKVIDSTDNMKPLSDIFRQARERLIVEEVHVPSERNDSTRQPTSSNMYTHYRPDSINDQALVQDATASDLFETNSSTFLDQPSLSLPAPATSNDSPTSQHRIPREQADYPVCSSTGYLLRHPVPSNNSCLFISVHFCLTNGIVDDQIGKSMRKIIADTVGSDKQHFDDAFLGKSNADYCKWILDDNNWGGAIELSILCKYYETEIVAIDVKNTLLNRFGEDSHYTQRMLLLYDGLHYDPLKFQPLDDNQPIQTLFSADNMEVLTLAEELAREAKQSHLFTDMNTITMKCGVCNVELDAKSAQEHAAKTGHVEFIEK